ncbi:ATP-dependent metallopeptidase FtsH/Yme1/Tma family protein [Vallitalea pronyensis]|uniref:ATP-dependent zinc metalloprotease FtsH n=1 Tax=Vallitalea pronyensis TaxID=1348613 RepID=A0A8J8MHP8_9FIRM|nr:ATP-dependent metallopeptidase FtsH/Yme1/Tma family protein [Vallitalea pronyensis]QUI21646.1 ATP-dependent metallopeptidase FtsH/Yme1/Tma family protein [Vallitalea pronyensis]
MVKNKKLLIIVISIIVVSAGIGSFFLFKNDSKEMTYNAFINHVENSQVEQVSIVDNHTLHVQLKDDEATVYTVPNPQTDNFKEFLLINDVQVGASGSSATVKTLQTIGVGLLIIGVLWYVRRGSSENKQVIVDANKRQVDDVRIVKFGNVAGNDEAKEMVKDIIDFIQTPDKYSAIGARMPRGVLLYGPPGTGKTLMAKAVAGEAGVPFYAVSGSDFIQMYVGVGASRIRKLFKKAKKSEKAVIFIDEIDAIGKKRAGKASASNDERDQTLNALLTEMSGFNDNDGIVVIAATNRVDTLDAALLRPGRFDRQIEIGLPDFTARKAILSLHAKNKPLCDSVQLDNLAKDTVCFSGAMLENLMNEAAIITANNNDDVISKEHIDKAFYTVIAGAEKKDRSHITEHDRKITAFHEAGHALVTKLLLPEHTISKVTIIPSTRGAGGFSMSIPKDKMYQSKREIKNNIRVLLSGRAAEEIAFGKDEITTGASNDIEKASQLVKDYIMKFGMDDELGIFNAESANMNDTDILKQCRQEIRQAYDETRTLLQNNYHYLTGIVDDLMEKETIKQEDIDMICA